MKKIIAINASPRTGWNTSDLVRETAKGAESAGAEVKVLTSTNLIILQDVSPALGANCRSQGHISQICVLLQASYNI